MVRAVIIFDSRNIAEGFLEASLQYEKGIEKTVMWYLFSKTYFQWSLHPLRFPSQGTETSGKKRETALLGARNRYALRLADQSGLASCVGWDRLGKTGGRWFFLTHSNMFEVDICGFVIRSFHFWGKLLQ